MRADSLQKEGQFAEASLMYDNAFELRKEIAYGFYHIAAYNNALAGNKQRAIKQFQKAVEGGLVNFRFVEEEELQVLYEEPAWKGLLELIAKREAKLDRPLIEELKVLHDKDQMFRQLLDCRKNQLSETQNKLLNEFVKTQDSLNLTAITTIIDRQGWPGKDIVGAEGNSTVWLVIQHASLDVQEKYLPMLEASVLKGESAGKDLGMLQDRVLMRQGKKQKYGTQIRRDEQTKQAYVYPIEEVENVDKRREAIGLAPMDEYLQRWKITMKDNYREEVKE